MAPKFVIPSGLRISYTLHQPTAMYAAFFKESRTRFTEATKTDRKSGGSREPALSEVEWGPAVRPSL